MSRLNIQLLCRRSIDFPELEIFASRPGAMINLPWLELPMVRTVFHGPKDVRAIEVRLYMINSQSPRLPMSGVNTHGPKDVRVIEFRLQKVNEIGSAHV